MNRSAIIVLALIAAVSSVLSEPVGRPQDLMASVGAAASESVRATLGMTGIAIGASAMAEPAAPASSRPVATR